MSWRYSACSHLSRRWRFRPRLSPSEVSTPGGARRRRRPQEEQEGALREGEPERLRVDLRRQPRAASSAGATRAARTVTLRRDGTLRAGPGAPNLGVLWYAARPYGDFSLRLQFRDDSPVAGPRANSGVQVRFPAPRPPVPGCPMTFNGEPQTGTRRPGSRSTAATRSRSTTRPTGGNDPRKTGSIYGFADLNARAGARHAGGRLERPGDPRRRPALHGHPQRRGHQRVREPARRAVPRPAERSGLRAPAGWWATSACRRTARRRTSCRSATSA